MNKEDNSKTKNLATLEGKLGFENKSNNIDDRHSLPNVNGF